MGICLKLLKMILKILKLDYQYRDSISEMFYLLCRMKRFDERNILKKKVNDIKDDLFVNPREVWFAHLGINVGNEEDGKGKSFQRPVLVMKKVGNMFFVVPMTTKWKENRFYYTLPDGYFDEPSRLILSQVKMVDKKRLTDKLTTIHEEDFNPIKEKLKALLL